MTKRSDHIRELLSDIDQFHTTEKQLVRELGKTGRDRDCKAAAWWVDGLEQLLGSIRAHAKYLDAAEAHRTRDKLHSVETTMKALREKAKSCIKAI